MCKSSVMARLQTLFHTPTRTQRQRKKKMMHQYEILQALIASKDTLFQLNKTKYFLR